MCLHDTLSPYECKQGNKASTGELVAKCLVHESPLPSVDCAAWLTTGAHPADHLVSLSQVSCSGMPRGSYTTWRALLPTLLVLFCCRSAFAAVLGTPAAGNLPQSGHSLPPVSACPCACRAVCPHARVADESAVGM